MYFKSQDNFGLALLVGDKKKRRINFLFTFIYFVDIKIQNLAIKLNTGHLFTVQNTKI